MDNFLYPLCLMAEDAERSGRTERQPEPDPLPAPAPTDRTPAVTVARQPPETTATRPNEKDWAMAAGLVMYFAMRGGC